MNTYNKLNSLTIININEEGNCFDDNKFTDFYNKNIMPIDTNLIIVCSQNSISRKIGCKHFQTLLRDKIENNGVGKYQLKNKKNSSGLVNISRHISIGELSSLGIRTRVYFKKSCLDPSLLHVTFKSINFTGSYGSILCTIEYKEQKKIHVINSCFFDEKTLGIFKKSYKNEKLDEYMKIIKEFELVKKINDELFFVGHNIKYNLESRFSNKKHQLFSFNNIHAKTNGKTNSKNGLWKVFPNNNKENNNNISKRVYTNPNIYNFSTKNIENNKNTLLTNKLKKHVSNVSKIEKIIKIFKGYNKNIQKKYDKKYIKTELNYNSKNKNKKNIKIEILKISY
jgi:hypothetical protein